MTKIRQDVAQAKGLLVVSPVPAPRTVPVPAAPPGSIQTSSTATSPSVNPLKGAAGRSQSYVLQAADVGRTSIQFGGRSYNLLEHLGRIIEAPDVGHMLMDSCTPDGWVLSLA